MSKKAKQEELTGDFDFSNIKNATKDFSKSQNTKSVSKVAIKFKVHKDLIQRFHILKLDFAKKNEKYSFSNNEMLKYSILFMEDSFNKKNILKECPDDFRKAIIKPGKRKATHRTFPFPLTDEILMTVDDDIAKKYMNIMFSFIVNEPGESIFNEYHSRTYFFYDFIDYLEKNKKEFLNFKID
jgi:hypothetical protein